MSKKNRQDSGSSASRQGDARPADSRFRMADYFWANLIFFSFLSVLSYVVWESCQAPSDDQAVKMVLADTFRFMVFLFGGGFLVVTLFDAAYDFFADKAEAEAPSEGH